MNEEDNIVINFKDATLTVPSSITIGNQSNSNWVFPLYLLALESNNLYTLDNLNNNEDQPFVIIYDWLQKNIFPKLSELHIHEILLGIGCLAGVDGILEYIPDEFDIGELDKL